MIFSKYLMIITCICQLNEMKLVFYHLAFSSQNEFGVRKRNIRYFFNSVQTSLLSEEILPWISCDINLSKYLMIFRMSAWILSSRDRDPSSRYEMTRNKYNLIRIRDKKRNFVLCEFQNRNSNTLFSLNSLNLFHFTYYLVWMHVLFVMSNILYPYSANSK